MHSKSITPATPPARAGLVQTVLDSLGDLYRLIQQGAAEPDTRRVYDRYQLAIPAAIALAAKSIPTENGAPRGGDDQVPEAAPSAGDCQVAGGTCGERGIRTPDTLAGTPDFESGTSPSDGNGSGEEGSDDGEPPISARAMRLAAPAWDLVDR